MSQTVERPDAPNGPGDRPPTLPRTLLLAGVVLLATGLIVALTGGEAWSGVTRAIVDLGLAAVMAVPILNVVGVMTIEWQRRARMFAFAAAVTLLMLALNVFFGRG